MSAIHLNSEKKVRQWQDLLSFAMYYCSASFRAKTHFDLSSQAVPSNIVSPRSDFQLSHFNLDMPQVTDNLAALQSLSCPFAAAPTELKHATMPVIPHLRGNMIRMLACRLLL
jgi:hypothetical protein